MNGNIVQYRIPKCTEIVFLIPSQERNLSMKLLDGSAKIQLSDDPKYLRLGREYVLPAWGNLNPRLKTVTGCEIMVQGNHYVYSAMTVIEGSCRNLFGVSLIEDSYVFFLEACMQLHILVDETASRFDVYLKLVRGAAEVFGYRLALDTKYSLFPCSSLVVRPENNGSCTLCVEGKSRRIKISMFDDGISAPNNAVHARLNELRLRAKENESAGPVVLVIGPTNVGKTSFCHFLLNKALEYNTHPAYVDLDVRRNTNTIPGSISLVKPEAKHSSIIGFSFSEQTVLYFGSLNFTKNNIPFYHHLVRRMGEILSANRTPDGKSHSGAIIDMCGVLSQDTSTIDCVLQSFSVDLVVVIGDRRFYDHMKSNPLLRNTESEFVPAPQNMEPPNRYREGKSMENVLKIYFSAIDKPMHLKIFQSSFSDFRIYRIVSSVHGSPVEGVKVNVRVEGMMCHPSIENYVLGVSQFANVDETLAIAQVKYFVIFTKVDVIKQVVTVLSPECEKFKGEILILGDVKMVQH